MASLWAPPQAHRAALGLDPAHALEAEVVAAKGAVRRGEVADLRPVRLIDDDALVVVLREDVPPRWRPDWGLGEIGFKDELHDRVEPLATLRLP